MFELQLSVTGEIFGTLVPIAAWGTNAFTAAAPERAESGLVGKAALW